MYPPLWCQPLDKTHSPAKLPGAWPGKNKAPQGKIAMSLYDRAADVARYVYDRRIDGPPVLDHVTHFPAAADFVATWRQIRDEALGVAADLAQVPRFHEIMPEQAEISANDRRDWRVFILKAYGVKIARNMARCPRLAALVEASPDVLSASLSFMAPRKHIPPHRGPFRGVLRFYLPLVMPRTAEGRPAAMLRIAGRDYPLAEGQCLLWDDTYVHEVWNRSDEPRTVLLLDVRRRGMPTDMALLSRVLIAAVRAGMTLRGVA
jgi:aspartate beta-hydroxylase